jgi:2-hydroxymuconate-semialdehyde hydrolase
MTDSNPAIGKSITADGYKVNYIEEGTGEPVILIHGAGAGVTAWVNWRHTMPTLARTHRAIALDMLGFGYTDFARGAVYSKEVWVDFLKSFIDALGLEKVSFIGNSFGGAMTLAFATRYPERVKNFVLMGAAGLSFDVKATAIFVNSETKVAPALTFVYQPSLENMRALVARFYYNRELLGDQFDEIVEHRHRLSLRPGAQENSQKMFPGTAQDTMNMLSSPAEKIAKIPHKVLVVHGREDHAVPVGSAIRMNELIARSQLHIFGQCGHWAMMEHRDRFNALISQFFNEKD